MNLFFEILGYVASVVVAISLVMSSLIKLRWINFFGAALFSTYGFCIGALPVGVLNAFIAGIDVYYLVKYYSRKEQFKLLTVRPHNYYLLEFLDYYKAEIKMIFPYFEYNPDINKISFFILRNMAVAGIFLAREYDDKTLIIGLDFVIPEYRDFKLGNFIYKKHIQYFKDAGYTRLCAVAGSEQHAKYLKRMGFEPNDCDGKTMYFKAL